MKKKENHLAGVLCEAVCLVSAALYIGLQLYYGFAYGVNASAIFMNITAMLLVYAGLTLLTVYPEKVNALSKEICTGKIRIYTIRMLHICKLIFVGGVLFTSICDVLGNQINTGYSLIVVVLIVLTAVFYEIKIIQILRKNQKK